MCGFTCARFIWVYLSVYRDTLAYICKGHPSFTYPRGVLQDLHVLKGKAFPIIATTNGAKFKAEVQNKKNKWEYIIYINTITKVMYAHCEGKVVDASGTTKRRNVH